MKKKSIIIKYNKGIQTKPDESVLEASSDTSVSNNLIKKFRPKWSQPLFSRTSGADRTSSASSSDASGSGNSRKKFRPKWSKPVFPGAPVAEKSVPEQSSSIAPFSRNREESKQDNISAPILNTKTPSSPSDADVFKHLKQSVVESFPGEKRNRRKYFGVVTALVVFLCAMIGYWYYQMQFATPKETSINVTAIPDKNFAEVSSKQNDTKFIYEEEVRNLVTAWLNSWKAGDIKTYSGFYTTDFNSKGMDLNAWVSHKAKVFKKSKNIKIAIDNLQISADANIATATFIQHYNSSLIKESGKKTLEFKKIDNEWKIYSEIM